MSEPFELITTGRIGVDLYPQQSERTLDQVDSFAKSLGGSAANVAVAAARLGCRAAIITKVGDDAFGAYLRDSLSAYGVDPRWVGVDPGLRTPIVFCEIFPPDHFPLLYYREPSAPDLQISSEELDLEAIAGARVFWTTGTGLCEEPSRTAVLTALAARAERAGPGAISVHDLDYRPMFWESVDAARRATAQALRHATIAVGNATEAEVATGLGEPRAAARALIEFGLQLAIIKLGGEGVFALAGDGAELAVDPIEVKVINGLGAGDAFGGTLAAGLVHGWGLERTLRAANAAGAIVASRLDCAPAMPTHEEIEGLAGDLGLTASPIAARRQMP